MIGARKQEQPEGKHVVPSVLIVLPQRRLPRRGCERLLCIRKRRKSWPHQVGPRNAQQTADALLDLRDVHFEELGHRRSGVGAIAMVRSRGEEATRCQVSESLTDGQIRIAVQFLR